MYVRIREYNYYHYTKLHPECWIQGVGRANATVHSDMHVPQALKQAKTAGAAPTTVVTPNTPPAAPTHVPAKMLHPVQHIPVAKNPPKA